MTIPPRGISLERVTTALSPARQTVVLHVGGLNYASEKAVVEQVLGHRPGVLAVDANPVAQTATVIFDPEATSIEALRGWVEDCGYHCAGQSVPGHLCDPLVAVDHGPHDHAAMQRADDAHGGGHGGHAGMSMDAMARDMRNRFLVALAFTIPIVLWSMVGTELLGTELARRPSSSDWAPNRYPVSKPSRKSRKIRRSNPRRASAGFGAIAAS